MRRPLSLQTLPGVCGSETASAGCLRRLRARVSCSAISTGRVGKSSAARSSQTTRLSSLTSSGSSWRSFRTHSTSPCINRCSFAFECGSSLEKAKVGSPSHDGERWDGQIDDSLRAFLSEADRYFEQVEAELRSRREAAQDFLRATESGGAPLPQVIEKREVDKWNDLEVFFQNVSHHRRPTNQRELETNVGDLEALLVSRLKLAVVEEYDEIDRLIEEGEAGA
jgi:hypothetical protein